MSARNLKLSRRWFDEVWNGRRDESVDELMSPGAVGHTESGDTAGLASFREFRDRFLGAFPDLQFEIEGIVASGDDVAVRWTARGTHAGEDLGISPTDRAFTVRGMTWHRFENGVMVEGWDAWNQEALLSRLRQAARPAEPRPTDIRRNLAARIRQIREEIVGESGPEMARRLGVPVRTWYNYETGVAVPSEVLLAFVQLTGADPHWLLTGEGRRYRAASRGPEAAAADMIRRGLEMLETLEKASNGLVAGEDGPP